WLESGVDDWLTSVNRAVVVSAGNGFEADCHAHDRVAHGAKSKLLHWLVHPFDPTSNVMEIWYNGSTMLDLWFTAPDGTVMGPVHLPAHQNIVLTSNGAVVGLVDHQTDLGNGDNRIDITLQPTSGDPPVITAAATASTAPPSALAPSGIWIVQLENVGAHEANGHAGIERDDG